MPDQPPSNDASVPDNAEWGLLFLDDRTIIPMPRDEAEMHVRPGVVLAYRLPGPWTAYNAPTEATDRG